MKVTYCDQCGKPIHDDMDLVTAEFKGHTEPFIKLSSPFPKTFHFHEACAEIIAAQLLDEQKKEASL